MNKFIQMVLVASCGIQCGDAVIMSVTFSEWTNDGALDLTAAGTRDWASWGNGDAAAAVALPAQATEMRAGGDGISNSLAISGLNLNSPTSDPNRNQGFQGTPFTTVEWQWSDGTTIAAGSQLNSPNGDPGQHDGGVRFFLNSGGKIAVTYAPLRGGEGQRASLLIRRDGNVDVYAIQGGTEQLVTSGQAEGLVSVDFNGTSPLDIELRATVQATVRGLAATLGVVPPTLPADAPAQDYGPSTGRIPATYADLILANLSNRDAAANYINLANGYFLNDSSPLPKSLAGQLRTETGATAAPFYYSSTGSDDLMLAYLRFHKAYPTDPLGLECRAKVKAFADVMLAHGTDRYGTKHSPLFSGILTRGEVPEVPQNPSVPGEGLAIQLFNGFAGNNYYAIGFGNIWFGSDESQKSSWRGADPEADQQLYLLLDELSEILGVPEYKAAADRSLAWFMANCPSETGMMPWGEHSGWDFFKEQYDRGYYHSRLHEMKGAAPIYDKMIELQPRVRPGELTAMERYVSNMLANHSGTATAGAGFQGMFLYCRHAPMWAPRADVGAAEDLNQFGSFPAHAGRWLRLWSHVHSRSFNENFRSSIRGNLNTLIDGLYDQRARLVVNHFPYGFYNANGTKRDNSPSNSQNDVLGQESRRAAFLMDDADLKARLLGVAADAGEGGMPADVDAYPGPPQTKLTGPAEGAMSVSRRTNLLWHGNGEALSYDVYLAKSPGEVALADSGSSAFQGNVTVAEFVPGLLEPDTTYFWAVDARTATGLTKGMIGSFTTGTVPLSYNEWIDSFTELAIADKVRGSDPDGDGLGNFIEYALGGNPVDGTDTGTSLLGGGGNFALVITVPAGAEFSPGPSGGQTASIHGITYRVEASDDLAAFTLEVSYQGPASEIVGLPSLVETGRGYHTFSPPAGERGFLTAGVND